MKKILSGNEAVARGCYEYGVHIATAFPGTPSTEILENIIQYSEINSEWSPNEKVAFEVAMGATFAGARTLVAMKHVGLNVAADAFMSMSLIGAPGGLVVVTADDPGMHSSQNEQDNRFYARFAEYPCLEPASSQEAKDFIGKALDISTQFDVPVLFRVTTRICHAQGVVECGERQEIAIKGFEKNPEKFVVLPAHAKKRHVWAKKRLSDLHEFANASDLNQVEMADTNIGIVTSGVAYQYVKEAMPNASVFKLGMTYPLPFQAIEEFSGKVKRLLVVEELEPFIENQLKAHGIICEGKAFWPAVNELNPDLVREGFVKAGLLKSQASSQEPAILLPRPPVFCPGCPHRGVYYALNKLKATVTTDIGCYTLGALPPLSGGDTCVEMGASIGVGVGMAKAKGSGKGIVATIGDSTFLHSGMTGLLNAVNDQSQITIIILDNRITAMTGGQHHPGSGEAVDGTPAFQVDLEQLCRALGVKNIKHMDTYNVKECIDVIGKEMDSEELSVIITNRPCALYPKDNRKAVLQTPFTVDADKCIGCHACFRVSCPAIKASEEKTDKGKFKSFIDIDLCTGCSVCSQVCPVQAITRIKEADA